MLVLASASPRRADLLRAAGLRFTVAPVACDERWLPGEAPAAYAARVAHEKATLAVPAHPGAVILAADTTVWTDPGSPPIGKPADRAEAAGILRMLAGRSHFVTTAFAIADTRGPSVAWQRREVTTRVHMRPIPGDELEAYLDADDWRDKAGGYGIQSRAAGIVTAIEGSYTAVVGLPLAEVVVALRALEVT